MLSCKIGFYAERHYAEYRDAECRGAICILSMNELIQIYTLYIT
jgi:hypothetical protein